mmetsp:Transcript_17271/g.27550  ORF Transcript_17271/g.27550 Transcript_17271/m.27550 type:complete len:91 (+) Transcript_17271:214-486(+)
MPQNTFGPEILIVIIVIIMATRRKNGHMFDSLVLISSFIVIAAATIVFPTSCRTDLEANLRVPIAMLLPLINHGPIESGIGKNIERTCNT